MLCFLVFLCCLDFGVWIIKLKKFPFFLLFSHLSSFSPFFFFPPLLLLSFEPFVSWLLHHLNAPFVASNCYLIVMLPCSFIVFSCCVTSLFHNIVSLLHHLASLPHCVVPLPRCLVAIALQVPSYTARHFLFCCLATSLPCVC
jgi:hypothetical protein